MDNKEEMMPLIDDAPKTQEQLQKEAFDREEARKAAQVDYDPKLHGAGTVEPIAPESVVALHKWTVNELNSLKSRLNALERRSGSGQKALQ